MTILKVDLIFKDKPNNKNPINLIFGGGGEEEVGEHISSGRVTLDDPTIFSASSINYGIDNNLIYSEFSGVYAESRIIFMFYYQSFTAAEMLEKLGAGIYGQAQEHAQKLSTFWGGFDKLAGAGEDSWAVATIKRSKHFYSWWSDAEQESSGGHGFWSIVESSRRAGAGRWGNAPAIDLSNVATFGAAILRTTFNIFNHWGKGLSLTKPEHIVWSFADLPGGCGVSIRPPYKPPIIPPNDNITIVKNLVFCHKPNNKNPINLIFGDECHIQNEYSIPDKGVYIVKNKVEIFRIDDGRIIKAFAVEIGANSKEYLWSGSLSLPFSELDKIIDKPELEININQYKFVVDVNEINTNQGFNSKGVEVSILSTTNRLKTIPAHNIGRDSSSLGIMSAQLQRDDLDTGFIFVNKDGEDWVINDNLIEYSDASALDVINNIVLAVGDSVISHAYRKEIMMKSKYPAGQPTYSLPVGKLFDYGTSETKSTEYNAIVVTGENIGITAVARKEGTAGEKMSQMIVEKLITADNAARRAAVNAIYNTAECSVEISAESVLFKEAPMIYPRDFVQIGQDVGWVEDVSIRAELSDKAIIVRHAMTIEKKVV